MKVFQEREEPLPCPWTSHVHIRLFPDPIPKKLKKVQKTKLNLSNVYLIISIDKKYSENYS